MTAGLAVEGRREYFNDCYAAFEAPYCQRLFQRTLEIEVRKPRVPRQH
jgi:hypothetical protein